MTDASFESMTRIVCSVKKFALDGTVSYVPSLKCTPLAPVDAETQKRLEINTPFVTWEAHFQGYPNIKKGDRLVIASVEYPVIAVERWPWLPTDDTRLRVIVEDTRNQ